MSHTLFLAFAFVAGATIGYSYVFRTDNVRDSMARICDWNSSLRILMGKWLNESPKCVPTLRMMGIFGLAVAAVTYYALLSRLMNRLP